MIRDRLNFMRFLGLGLGDAVPDAKTIWLFRERLKEKDLIDHLFDRFDRELEDRGLLAPGDGCLGGGISAPPQRTARKGDHQIGRNAGRLESQPAKMEQKATDARCPLERGRKKESMSQLMVPSFCDRGHINIDKCHRQASRFDPIMDCDGRCRR